ncbi:MAG: PQQ-binding-like beta-propeller repeat protein [Gemmataceae bacterium]
MSIRSRRALLVMATSATLAGIAAVGTLHAQRATKAPLAVPAPPGVGPGMPGRPGVPQKKPGYDLGSLTLPKDDDLVDRIEAAQDNIKRKDWDRACETLQALVGRHEDVFVPITRKTPDGAEQSVYVSVKKEAARLISTMPKPGRDMYEAKFGEKATTVVKRARTNNDRVEMAQAMSLYLYTEAGADAANWLATFHLDRAEFQAASRYYQQLINRGGIRELKPRTLLKAAYAFHQAGDRPAKEEVFKELERRNAEVKLRDEPRSPADLQESINRMVASVSLQSASDSPIYRGRPNRTAMLPGGTPFLEPAWKAAMVRSERTRERIKLSETHLASLNQPLLTTFVPVTATMTKGERKVPLLIFKSFWGLHVVDMKSGKLVWDSPSDWSLDLILGADSKVSDAAKVGAYNQWLNSFQTPNSRPQILFENSTLSTVSADSKNVYAIEDLAVPPPQVPTFDPRFGGAVPVTPYGKDVSDAIQHNKLQAFDLNKDGKLAWEVGGREEKHPLSDTYFLGAPLPLNGRLYVLTERQQEIRLAALDPGSGKLLGTQTLAATKDLKLSQDPMRRIQACHLAYGEGILVVPTNAGAVFGVDLLSNSLLWAYPYRVKEDATASSNATNPGMPGLALGGGGVRFAGAVPAGMVRLADGRVVPAPKLSGWMVTAPAVAEGKVVFTAPDAPEVHCVNLRDGSRLWSLPREQDDLYLAGVYNGKVVIVGKKRTRAVSLVRGEKLWELDTGLPAGQGAAGAPNAAGDVVYYLPVREAVNTREPEICAINIDRGLVHAHTRSRKREVPGNLIFYEGNVLSQTHTEVVAYPQLEIKLAEMDRQVRDNPNDPVALTERGDYLLDKGDLGGAINDFRKALKQQEIPEGARTKARAKLYEAYTEYFQRDFARAEEYIKEYEEICRVDLAGKTGAERTALEQEGRRRRANFLCLVGKGREGQNRLVEAFERYLELGLEAKPDELIQVVDEPSVKAAPDVWSQGRIAAMVADAKDPRQRQALEDRINQRWAGLKQSNAVPLDDLRKFVSLFGSLFGVGKEARLALAERLMEDTDVGSLLEAEQQLSLLRGDGERPEVAARALEALARLNTRKGLLEDAAYYYRLLGERYPNVKVEGRAGSEYLEDLATDKRFLPYLDQAGRYVLKGKVELRSHEDKAYRSGMGQTFQFEHAGEALPFFHRHKLALQMDYSHQLKLTDLATGEERWKPSLSLTRTHFREIVAGLQSPNGQINSRVKFPFQTQGHLVVLQLGHMVFGIDPLGKGRVLWEKNLSSLPGSATAPPGNFANAYDPRDNGLVLTYSDGWTQRLGGEGGPLQGGVTCLQMRDQLTAIDPVSGRTLWTRTDVTSRAHVFGDDQYIYVVNLGENNNASGTRVFRAYDGVSVKARDFTDVFQHRVRIQGRNVLTAQHDPKNQLVVRLYDVIKGQDLWKQTFPAGTIQLTSEDPRLAGVAEPDGTVRVTDIATGKELLNTKLADPKHLAGAREVYLAADPDYFFVAVNGPADANQPAWAQGPQPNVQVTSGLRSVPVNGMVYCFNRQTGQRNWYNPVENQQMILTQFDELPVVLFTARYQVISGGPGGGRGGAVTAGMRNVAQAVAKHNGKLWYDNPTVPGDMYFDTLTMDHRTGKVEFAGQRLKAVLTAVPK